MPTHDAPATPVPHAAGPEIVPGKTPPKAVTVVPVPSFNGQIPMRPGSLPLKAVVRNANTRSSGKAEFQIDTSSSAPTRWPRSEE